MRVQSESSSAQNPTFNGPASIPPANEVSEPVDRQGHLGTRPAPVDEHVAEEGPVLSRVVPRRGPVSGGEEIALIVSNLPPTIKLYARFGCNIALTVSGIILSRLEEYICCADVSLLGSSCARGTFLSSPPCSASWSGQRHIMSSTFYRCRIPRGIFCVLRV